MWAHYKNIPLKMSLNGSTPEVGGSLLHICKSAPETIPPMPTQDLFYMKVGRVEERVVLGSELSHPGQGKRLFLMQSTGKVLSLRAM